MFKWLNKKTSIQENNLQNQANLESDYATSLFAQENLITFESSEILKKFNLQRYRLKYLEEDIEVSRCVDIRLSRVLMKEWHIECNNKTLAKWLTQQLKAHYQNIITTAWRSCLYGYSVFEINYELINDKIELKSVNEKPFEWFYPTHYGDLMYIGQNSMGNPIKIQVDELLRYKFVMTRNQATYENPYGKALLISCYLPTLFKSEDKKNWMQWLERFAQPFVVGKTESANVSKFNSFLGRIGRGSSIAIRKEDEINVIDANNSAGQHFKEMFDTCNLEIQRMILGQEVAGEKGTAMGQHGFMLADKVSTHIEQADVQRCFESIQKVIDNLLELNNINIDAKIIADLDSGLSTDRASRDATLISNNIVSGFTKDYIQRAYDLEENDFILNENLTQSANIDTQFSKKNDILNYKFSDNNTVDLPSSTIKKIINQQKMIQEIAKQSSENVSAIYNLNQFENVKNKEDLEKYLLEIEEDDLKFTEAVKNTFAGTILNGFCQ